MGLLTKSCLRWSPTGSNFYITAFGLRVSDTIIIILDYPRPYNMEKNDIVLLVMRQVCFIQYIKFQENFPKRNMNLTG